MSTQLSTFSTLNRHERQSDIISQEKLNCHRISVVGVGAIGRQVALQLAAIGTKNLQLIDFDTVEDVNLAAQGFMEADLGTPKVKAVGDICRQINSDISIFATNGKFKKSDCCGDIVFCCVDSIATRKFIWQAMKYSVNLLIDGRMLAEYFRVISLTHENMSYYPETLFDPDEAPQIRCTAKSTIYCANIAAGMMVSQLTKWLRGFEIDRDFNLNLLSMELNIR